MLLDERSDFFNNKIYIGANMSIVKGFLGIVIFSWLVYLPIYILFFDSEESAIKSISLADAIAFSLETKLDSKEDIENIKDAIDNLAEKIEDDIDIDIRDSIYDALKDNEKVSDVELEKVNAFIDASHYVIRFKYEGKYINIPFVVSPPSLFDVREAKAMLLADPKMIGALGLLYGMSEKDARNLMRVSMSSIPK